MLKKSLAVGIIFFLVISSVPYSILSDEISTGTFGGNTLYVGGTGPGNYSKIQEAINDASDGDTIFVYSGTYDEKIILDKSLKLSGEKGAILLQSTGWPPRVIEVNSTGCSIEGFTIKLSFLQTGIYVKNANTIISKNTFTHKTFDVYGSKGVYTDNAPNTIIQHNIFENTSGIYIINSKFTKIVNNTIITKENPYLEQRTAIRVESNQPSYATILHNSIVDASGIPCSAKLIYGIILDSQNNGVFSNEINNTYCGVYTLNCDNVIRKNNFLNTTAYFKTSKLCRITDINKWEANYWGEPKKSYIIYGELYLKFLKDPIPWINIDWHPAKKPYDITAGGA